MQVAHLHAEQQLGVRELRVRLEGLKAELDARDGAEQQQPHVEEEGIHHGLADAHRVDGDAEEAHPNLHAPLDHAKE